MGEWLCHFEMMLEGVWSPKQSGDLLNRLMALLLRHILCKFC